MSHTQKFLNPNLFIFLTILIWSLITMAKLPFVEVENCGTAQVIGGDTCSNVKVQFVFDGCRLESPPQIAARIICENKTIKARLERTDIRYEAQFKKEDNGWGGVSWKPMGSVRQLVRAIADTAAVQEHPIPNSKTPIPDSVAEVANPPRALAQTDQPHSLSVTGFIDYRHTNTWLESGNTAVRRERIGYLFEDGALYFNFKKENIEAFVDLPFFRNATSNTDNASLAFAETKAQAWMAYNFSESMKIVIGQFDTLYGFELNDSKDRLFGNYGLVYSQTLPIVHSGAYFQYSQSGFTAKLLSANPADRDSFGNTPNDSGYETGATLGYSNDWMRSQLGYLSRVQDGLDGSTEPRTLTDILLGFSYWKLALDLQYSLVKNPRKNTLTTDATDSEDPGSGFMAHLAFKPLDRWTVGFRYELIQDDPAAGASTYFDVTTWGFVAMHELNDNLKGRVEYFQIESKRRSSVATDIFGESRLDIGLTLSF
jgi:hypothetical protein